MNSNNVVKRYDLTLKNLADNLNNVVAPILSVSPFFLILFSAFSLFAVFFLYASYTSFLILDNGLISEIKNEADTFKDKFKNYLEEKKALEKTIKSNEEKIQELTQEQNKIKERMSSSVNNSLATSSLLAEPTKNFRIKKPQIVQERAIEL